MSDDPSRKLCVKHQFNASPERVFDAWLNPATAGKWLFTAPGGEMRKVEIDPRAGGRFIFIDRREGQDIEHVGEYFEINRPRRLVFSFGVPTFSPEFTRVTVDIEPTENGCELTLTHENVLPEWLEPSRQGWTMILDNLAKRLDTATEDQGTITASDTVRFERLLPGPIERVWNYLVDSEKRGQWLASGEMPARVGAEVTFAFNHQGLSPHKAPPPEKYKDTPEIITTQNRVTCYEPPFRLGIVWCEGPDASDVLFELAPEGDQVRLTLTHSRLKTRQAIVEVSGGWHTHLAVLTERLSGRVPPAFWTLFGDVEQDYKQRFDAE